MRIASLPLSLALLPALLMGCLAAPSAPPSPKRPAQNPAEAPAPGELLSIPEDTPPTETPPLECEEPNCPGQEWPTWELHNFQPHSDRFGETYGLSHFEGNTTVVVLLAGWCSYCRKQALQLERLSKELLDQRHDVNIVVINKDNASSERHQNALLYVLDQEGEIQEHGNGAPIYRSTLPLFQDTEETLAWELHHGKKDDFFIYDHTGTLAVYLPQSNTTRSTNLSTEEGYNNLKQAILEVEQARAPEVQNERPSAH
ncbi:MAG: redoxin family protein [Myxococcota bacterium]|nr:redoxin family protein [Myxococcota bacterium]